MKAEKAALRTAMRRCRTGLDAAIRGEYSRAVAARLQALPEYCAAGSLLAYMSLPDEVQTDGIIVAALAAGKRVALPRVAGRTLALHWWDGAPDRLMPGVWGIRQPRPDTPAADPAGLELILLPGLAYDQGGGRLGQGGGYYDRLLLQLPAAVPRVAIVFAFQVVPAVPRDAGDQLVDIIVTDRGTIRTAARQGG